MSSAIFSSFSPDSSLGKYFRSRAQTELGDKIEQFAQQRNIPLARNADGTIEVIPSQGGQQQPEAQNPLEGSAGLENTTTVVPAVLKDARCPGCGKLLARALGPGSEIECRGCKELVTV